MLAKRIIPCLDVRDGKVVKGINFVGIREVGDPVECAEMYNAQGADEIRQAARRCALGNHLPDKIVVLLADVVRDCALELVAGEIGEIIIRQIFELDLIGLALKPRCIGRGDNRIGQLPDLAHRILERAVAVHHHLDVPAGALLHHFLHVLDESVAVAREQLHRLLGGLVGSQQSVLRIEAAAVDRRAQDIVEREHDLAAGLFAAVVALLSVGWQSRRAADADPVESLKN